MADDHAHIWIANGGLGGRPMFALMKMGPNMMNYMEVKCKECGEKLFVTERQWFALNKIPVTEVNVRKEELTAWQKFFQRFLPTRKMEEE